MKKVKFLMLMLLMPAAVLTASADDDMPITVDQLPQKSQQFIQTYFKGIEVSFAKVDKEMFDRTYEVFFVNGNEVEFDKKGEWTKVDCHRDAVPEGIVPQPIRDFVQKNNQGQKIVKIERDRRDYEIELGNGLEIKFDLKFNVIGYDH